MKKITDILMKIGSLGIFSLISSSRSFFTYDLIVNLM